MKNTTANALIVPPRSGGIAATSGSTGGWPVANAMKARRAFKATFPTKGRDAPLGRSFPPFCRYRKGAPAGEAKESGPARKQYPGTSFAQ